jgi:hypothetical protein
MAGQLIASHQPSGPATAMTISFPAEVMHKAARAVRARAEKVHGFFDGTG